MRRNHAPVTDPVPGDTVPGFEDDEDLSCASSDHHFPSVPDPASDVPSHPSIPLDDLPSRSRTKHVKRLSGPATAFPFSAPKVPVIPKSAAVPFRK